MGEKDNIAGIMEKKKTKQILSLTSATVLDENYDVTDDEDEDISLIRARMPQYKLCMGLDVGGEGRVNSKPKSLKLSNCPSRTNNIKNDKSAFSSNYEPLYISITADGRLVDESTGHCITAVFDDSDLEVEVDEAHSTAYDGYAGVLLGKVV